MTAEFFGFLTCEASTEVHPVDHKAMPVILTRPEERRCWLTTGTSEALKLQQPLANGPLAIVAEGTARPVSLVIAALETPISLTAGRRLQLAAEAGDTTGLILIQEGRGGNAATTRWQCDPLPSPLASTRHRWILDGNKGKTNKIHDVSGIVAEVRLRPDAPLSPLGSDHALDLGGAECIEAVHD